MCLEVVGQSMQQISDCWEENVMPPIRGTQAIVCGFWNERCKEVKVLTDTYLPHDVAAAAQKVFNALPYTMYFQYSPPIISIPVAISYIAAHIANPETPPFSTRTYKNIYNGMGCSRTLDLSKNIIDLVVTREPCHIVGAIFNAIGAAYAFHKAETM